MFDNMLKIVLFLFFCSIIGCESESSSSSSSSSSIMVGTETHWLTLCEDESACGDELSCVCGLCTKTCESADACGGSDISQCLSTSQDLRCEGADAPSQSATVCWPRETHPAIMFEICNDQIDNNGDQLIDCEDPSCAGQDFCVEGDDVAECSDQVDNDGDGLIDCNDDECAQNEVCIEGDTLEECFDGLDNNQNGIVDCEEPRCASSCKEGDDPEECFDNIDNDGNGILDCEDQRGDCRHFM